MNDVTTAPAQPADLQPAPVEIAAPATCGSAGPQRIACLSSETVEVLYALGQAHRIAGITAFARHPAGVTKLHPIISGFSTAKAEKIFAVQPDLVLAYSGLQGEIVKECIQAGLEVHFFNQRSIAGILGMIATLGRLLDCQPQAQALIAELNSTLAAARAQAATLPRRPRVYFEEWHSPLYSGIRWVSELIEIAGGEDIFAARSSAVAAKDRTVSADEVIAAAPELMIASWCGQPLDPAQVYERAGWAAVPALARQQVHEIASHDLLVPGITAITRGLPQLQTLITAVALEPAA
ncbi:ABC transporter substrate-binding protein [Chitinibacter tainanensis]|uniref:ABC transporter substrate-binding protein n=1 Tax=Chitinibacter tainanensis TaxID=230667 RepID=UPI0023559A05|nr:ABC transporter substrate-binding protein [Chitinibacter tainanensis]